MLTDFDILGQTHVSLDNLIHSTTLMFRLNVTKTEVK